MVAYSVGGVHKMLPLCCILCILCMVAYCGSTKHKDKDKDKEALFNARFETDNLSSVELLLRHND